MLGPLSALTGEFVTGKSSSKVLQVQYPNSRSGFFPSGPFDCLFLRAGYYNIIVQLPKRQTSKTVSSSRLLILYPVLIKEMPWHFDLGRHGSPSNEHPRALAQGRNCCHRGWQEQTP